MEVIPQNNFIDTIDYIDISIYLDTIDYMDTSIIHVKAPHKLHIAVKVAALKSGKSMNQFAVDCLTEAVRTEQVGFTKRVLSTVTRVHSNGEPVTTNPDIDVTGPSKPVGIIKTPEDAVATIKSIFPEAKALCKIHGTPLDDRGKCMQKGCKYA